MLLNNAYPVLSAIIITCILMLFLKLNNFTKTVIVCNIYEFTSTYIVYHFDANWKCRSRMIAIKIITKHRLWIKYFLLTYNLFFKKTRFGRAQILLLYFYFSRLKIKWVAKIHTFRRQPVKWVLMLTYERQFERHLNEN